MSEADSVAKLAQKAAGASTIKTEDGREFLITPDGFASREISDEHSLSVTSPRYIKQAVTLQTTDALVEYVNRYKGSDTVLFADIMANSIVAVVDYHAKIKAAHAAHRGTLTLGFSIEWAEWNKISGRLMEQLEFARFIEENGADVKAPVGAELLECVRDLQAHRKVNFSKAVRTSSENENFEYTEETNATRKGGIEVPTKFQLGIPVYFGEPDTEVFAFLRWKLGDGNLTLGIALHRAEHVRQAVFKQIVLLIGEQTKCPVVFGKL